MVTTVSKPVVKRRPKLKNSTVAKADEVIVNGVNPVNNILVKQKELYSDKYRAQGLNHFNNAKTDANSLESINSILSKLNKDCDPSSNHRVRLAGIKYADVNHVRNAEASSSVNYSRIQYNNSSAEFDTKPYVNNVVNQKFNNTTAFGKMKKLDELRTKSEEYSLYLPDPSPSKLTVSTSQYDGLEKAESRFGDSRKFEVNAEKNVPPELGVSRSCENKLFLRAKRRKQNRSKWQMDGGTRHEALQRIRGCTEQQKNLQNDLYPLSKFHV